MYPISNTTSKLIVTVLIKLQINEQPNWLFIQNPSKLNGLIFRFNVYISEIFALVKSCRISPNFAKKSEDYFSTYSSLFLSSNVRYPQIMTIGLIYYVTF